MDTTAPATLAVATYKVGANKGRPRVWLDGPRLTAAGFTPGTRYYADAMPGGDALLLTVVGPSATPDYIAQQPPGRVRVVSGRPGGKPIIDILGRTVEAAFRPVPARVAVTFATRRITITPAPEA